VGGLICEAFYGSGFSKYGSFSFQVPFHDLLVTGVFSRLIFGVQKMYNTSVFGRLGM